MTREQYLPDDALYVVASNEDGLFPGVFVTCYGVDAGGAVLKARSTVTGWVNPATGAVSLRVEAGADRMDLNGLLAAFLDLADGMGADTE